MTSSTTFDLAVVICSFRREALLEKTLASIAAQRRPAGLSLMVGVVDNSDEGSAAAVVAEAARRAPFPVRRIAAHPANISVARNAGVRETDSSFLAFVDDDQELAPGWLEAVAQAIATTPHDVLFGAVEPAFEAPERVTPAIRQLFSRRIAAAPGADLLAHGPEKTRGVALGSGNTIFRRATTLDEPEPFRAAFGAGGGEDYDLLCRLQDGGRRLGWLPQALALEFVPASRCDPTYLKARFFAGGQAFAAAIVGVSARPRLAAFRLRAKAALQAGALALKAPTLLVASAEARRDYTYRWAGILGKLAQGEIRPIYQLAAPPRRSARGARTAPGRRAA